jgi:hypothetical protein
MAPFKRDERLFDFEDSVESIFSSFASATFRLRPRAFDAVAFFCAPAALRACAFLAASAGNVLRVSMAFFFSLVFAIVLKVCCTTRGDERLTLSIWPELLNVFCSELLPKLLNVFSSELLLLHPHRLNWLGSAHWKAVAIALALL